MGQSISSRASAAVSDTAGGRVAVSINENSKTSHSDKTERFDGDSVSGSDEFADFINRDPTPDYVLRRPPQLICGGYLSHLDSGAKHGKAHTYCRTAILR
ncbi:Conjugative transfer protein TrbL [Pseudomonas coronafaciens pv. atropurpurea]|nr:Conjugative transfer protein TrbL [Pseudomonas coronafaciens pv. atropurpurea]